MTDTRVVASPPRKPGSAEKRAKGAAAEAVRGAHALHLPMQRDLRGAVAGLEVDVMRWFVPSPIAVAGALSAAMKFAR